jgi:hypothetical protein
MLFIGSSTLFKGAAIKQRGEAIPQFESRYQGTCFPVMVGCGYSQSHRILEMKCVCAGVDKSEDRDVVVLAELLCCFGDYVR